MKLFSVSCTQCGKTIYRDRRRINESLKFGWKSFCSSSCYGYYHSKQKTLICSRPGCGKIFKRSLNQIRKAKASYCSHSCGAIINNLAKHKKVRICPNPICRNEFTGYNKYCSLGCIPIHKTKYSKKRIISEILSFVRKVGRIPTKRELGKLNRMARKNFGTWNKAIESAGFKPNPVMFARKFNSKDGHKCDSLAERIIDDWFNSRKTRHERNIPYPGDGRLTVDFKVGNYWVEFFGLSGEHKRYDQLKRKKIRLAKKLGLNLVKIYPKDLFPKSKLSEKFLFLLK